MPVKSPKEGEKILDRHERLEKEFNEIKWTFENIESKIQQNLSHITEEYTGMSRKLQHSDLQKKQLEEADESNKQVIDKLKETIEQKNE